MKKKVLSVLLSLALSATVLVGCGGDSETPAAGSSKAGSSEAASSGSGGGTDLEPVTLKWYLHGSNVTNDKDVLAAVNEYLGEKLNVTLEPIWGTWGDFDTNAVLALQGGDDVDIYFTCSWSANEYNKFARDGYYVRLDDPDNNLIEKYGQDVWAILPDALKAGSTIKGSDGVGVYAINGYKDYATQNCWDINVPLLEKYGYTVDDIANTDYFGFGEIMETVKKGEGDSFYPLLVEGAVLERMATNSIIVTGDSSVGAMLSYYMDPTDVSKPGSAGNVILNKYATEEYQKFAEKTREYYLAGYIDPAMANTSQANDARTAHQMAGTYLIGTQSYAMGYEVQASAERGFEVAMVPAAPAYVDTTVAQGAMMAISTASKNPERAMMFLNLLNTDPYLMTLLEYGVEGTHYELNGDGEVVFLEARGDYTPWTNGMGNVTQLPPLEGQGKDFWQEFIDYYAQAKGIPIIGYTFDPSVNPDVETAMAALGQVASEYAMSLNTGFVDPATALPEFLKKLEDNGIQKVVDEANKQLEEFLAAK
ncbi:MAG: ABC transporter substrate-binding protein [Clostridium sp.]|jgi:putative aldouronate transport system substrate-binding protein|nr:ABC transporter substrate-binding protein [Clostridium sp.]